MGYGIIKECYYAPYSLNKMSAQVLNTLQSNRVAGIDVKDQSGLDYFDFYEKLVFSFSSTFNMLQINVRKGYSIVTWLRRFPNCRITAIEKSLDDWKHTEKYFNLQPSEKARLTILQLDPETADFNKALKNQNFDIILAHGHRSPEKRIDIFNRLFPSFLAPDGMYILEDTFCENSENVMVAWAQGMIPYTYKTPDWKNCKTLYGRRNISEKMKGDWRYTIGEITFHRDIIVFTKESLLWT